MGGVFSSDALDRAAKRETYRRLLEAAHDLAAEHKCVSLTTLTNPFDPDVHLYEPLGAVLTLPPVWNGLLTGSMRGSAHTL